MSDTCPLCGAALPPGETCRERFEQCLALEYEHPAAYGAAHFLTVACYMLQHNAYSQEAWLGMRGWVEQYLRGELTTGQIRARHRRDLDSGRRSWSVTRGPKLEGFERIRWSSTIFDVRLDSPEQYVADVRRWAKRVVEDSTGVKI